MYNVSLIKYLYQAGYRQKLICIITGYPQSTISKHSTNPRPYVPTLATANENQLRRKAVIDTILQAKVLKKVDGKMFSESDKQYVKLLDWCLVDRDKIRKLYHTTDMGILAYCWSQKKEFFYEFNPRLLDIEPEDWDLFMEQVQK